MKHLAPAVLTCAIAVLIGGCGSSDQAAAPKSAAQTATAAPATAAPMVAATTLDAPWPPAGCPNADGIKTLLADPNMQTRMAFLGIYSGDDVPTNNGNRFWLGTNHGSNVQPPNSPLMIPGAKLPGLGWLLRWNISDTVIVDGGSAQQQVSSHYAFDYDAARDGEFAVNALAINKCTNTNKGLECEQALFGKAAWQADGTGGDPMEVCPPVILSDDPSSLYAYDLNQNTTIETYEYSVALTLGGNDGKQGLRVIIDPRVQNGGVTNR